MNPSPLVTVGITCFNAQDSIARAIESALDQTYLNLEIIIVDDASLDGSVGVIEEYVKNNNNVTLIKHAENSGAPSSYNSIVKNTKGKYISFFDDDDFSHSDRVEKTTLALEENSSSDMVCFCDRYVQGSDNKKKIIKGLTRVAVTPKELAEHMLDTLCYQYDRPFYRVNTNKFTALRKHDLAGSSAGTGIMTAPTVILKKYLFDPHMYRFCDTELNLRMFRDGISAFNINTPLMTQFVTLGADKASIVEKESVYHALTKHREIYRAYGVYYPGVSSIEEGVSRVEINMEKDSLPLVTIGIVAENSDKTIFEVIKNALSQNYSNIELIVIDNNSSDSTLNILSDLDDARLKLIKNEKRFSKSHNLDKLVSNANGEFTVFFDDKDIALRHRVGCQIGDLLEKEQSTDKPVFSLADYYDHTSGFVGVHHCLGALGDEIDSTTLNNVIWHILIRHSESKYLLSGYSIPFYEYALFSELLCGRTKVLRDLGMDSFDLERMAGLEMLIRFSELGGVMVNKRRPLVSKVVNPLRCGQWPEVVKDSNAVIERNRDGFKKLFGMDSEAIIFRNNLKVKLMKRIALIKKYL